MNTLNKGNIDKTHFVWFKSFDDANCEVTNTKKCIDENFWKDLKCLKFEKMLTWLTDMRMLRSSQKKKQKAYLWQKTCEHHFSHKNIYGMKYLLIELVVHMLKIIV